MAKNNNIQIKIEAIDKLTPILNKIDNTLSKLNKTLNSLQGKFGKALSSKELDRTTKSFTNLRKEAITTINEISKYYKKAEKLGGMKALSPAELGRVGGLKRKLNLIKEKLPSGERQSVELAEFEKIQQAKERLQKLSADKIKKAQEEIIKIKENALKKERKAFIDTVKSESKWNAWLYADKVKNLKKQLTVTERAINQLIQKSRYEGRLTFGELRQGRQFINKYKKLSNIAVAQGIMIPEEAQLRLQKFEYQLNHTNKVIGTFNSKIHEWWKRFGAVALGFTLMYRAMVLFENGLTATLGLIKEGIQTFDEFREASVRLAMFYRIFAGEKSVAKSIEYSISAIQGLKSATVDALSPIQDITQGLDELAQHGVFLSASMMKDFVNLTDFIGMIAKTSTSMANQIRQELQALFEGTKRAGNTLIRFLSKAFKDDVVKQIQSAISPTEQFYMIMKKISDYVSPMKQALFSSSFTLSLQRAKNIFNLLVNDAIILTNKMNKLPETANIFAISLNKSLESLGLVSLKKLYDARIKLAEMKKAYEDNKISLEKLNEAQKEYDKQLEAVSKSPAGDIVENLANLFNILSVRVLPSLVNMFNSLITGLSVGIVKITDFYDRFKPLIDAFIDVIKWLVIFRVSIATLKFVMVEPLFIIAKLVGSLHEFGKSGIAVALPAINKLTKALSFIPIALSNWKVLLAIAGNSLINFSKNVASASIVISKSIMKISKAFTSLLIRVAPAIIGIWTLFSAIFYPKRFGKLAESVMLVIRKSFLDGAEWVVDILGNVFDKIPELIFKPIKAIASKIIELNKSYDKLIPDNLVEKAKALTKIEFTFGKDLANKVKRQINIWKQNIDKEIEKTGSPLDNFVELIKAQAKDFTKAFTSSGVVNSIQKAFTKLFDKFKSKNKKLFKIEVKPEVVPKKIDMGYVYDLWKQEYDKLKRKIEKSNTFSEIFLFEGKKSEENVLKTKIRNITKELNKIRQAFRKVVDLKDKPEKINELYKRILELEKALDETQNKLSNLRGEGVKQTINDIQILSDLLSNLSNTDWLSKQKLSVKDYNELVSATIERLSQLENEYRAKISKERNPERKRQLQNEFSNVIAQVEKVKEAKKEIDIILSDVSPLEKWRMQVGASFEGINLKLKTEKAKIEGVSNLLTKSLNTVGQSLTDALTGKLKSFEDFMYALRDTVIKAIMDMVIELAKLKAMNLILGSKGGVTSSYSPNTATGFELTAPNFGTFAEGGIVTRPTTALIGEAGYPEAVIPLKTGKVPVEVKGQQTGQPIVVNVNVNAVDAQSFAKYKSQIIEMVSEGIKKGKLTGQIRRIV